MIVRREKMSRKSSYASVELEESARVELKKLGGSALVSRKLEAIIAACEYSISEVAKIYGITRKTLLFWIKNFQETRIENLKAPPSRRRKSVLNDSDRAILKEIIENDSQVAVDFFGQKSS
jgi:transposase-like protein